MELRRNIQLLLLAASVLFVGITGWLLYRDSARYLEREIEGKIGQLTSLFVQLLIERSDRLTAEARLIASLPSVQSVASTGNRERIARATRNFTRNTEINLILFSDVAGHVLAASRSEPFAAWSEEISQLPAKVPMEQVYLLETGDWLFQAVTVPVEAGGHPLGFLTVALALDESFLADVTRSSDGHLALLADGHPRVASPEFLEIAKGLDFRHLRSGAVTLNGNPWRVEVSAPQGMLSNRVQVAAFISKREDIAKLSGVRRNILMGALGGIAVLALLGRLFVHRLMAPLERLKDAAGQVARGNLDMAVPEEGVGEIRDLSHAFNAMLSAVQSRDRQLNRQMRDLEALREGASDAIFIFDLDGKVVTANGRACEWTGRPLETLKGADLYELITTREQNGGSPVSLQDMTGSSVFDTLLLGPGGKEIPVEISGGLVPDIDPPVIQLFARDLRERRHLQDQLLRAQKLEAIGTLAGGIAHDFNNILTGIGGYTGLVRMDLPADHPAQAPLETVEEAVERGARLCRQLLSAARKDQQETGVTDLNGVAREVVSLCQQTFPPAISLELSVGEDGRWIEADPSQVHQVLMNLLVNARDAIGERPGRISITSKTVRLGEDDPLVQTDELALGGYLALSVRDSGSGISTEVRGRIFDPFFTTKERGKGTGLGLATVFGIMRNHGGTITVDSDPGSGAEFTCYFRLSPQGGSVVPGTLSGPGLDARKQRPAVVGRRVLVVDDETSVRELIRSILENAGHRVATAENGRQAVDYLSGLPGEPPELLVVDMLMPGMDGRETARELRRLRPRLPVIFVTGYMGDDISLDGLGEPAPVLLTKPFRMRQLLNTVEELCAKGAAETR